MAPQGAHRAVLSTRQKQRRARWDASVSSELARPRGWLSPLLSVPLVLLAAVSNAEPEGDDSEDFAKMSLDEVSRKLENPLSKLWSLTLQENLSLNTRSSVPTISGPCGTSAFRSRR